MQTLVKKILPVLGAFVLTYFLVQSIPLILGENAREESVKSVSMALIIAWLMLIAVPLLWIKYAWKDNIRNYGWRLPEMNKKNWITFLTFFVLLVTVGVLLSNTDDFRNYYKLESNSLLYFSFFGLITPLLYFIAEEFIFHGFLFFRLLKKIGRHSYWIVSILFMILHIGKPTAEVFTAFFVSLSLCATAHKTKSFLPAAILHFVLATTINVLISYT